MFKGPPAALTYTSVPLSDYKYFVQPVLNGSMTATRNQKKCMSTDICYLLSGHLWTNISHVGSAEKTGPPIAVWLGARASTNPCLRADTPEFS